VISGEIRVGFPTREAIHEFPQVVELVGGPFDGQLKNLLESARKLRGVQLSPPPGFVDHSPAEKYVYEAPVETWFEYHRSIYENDNRFFYPDTPYDQKLLRQWRFEEQLRKGARKRAA
jgi:hypothetical protein